MKVLAMDTSGISAALAILEDQSVLAEILIHMDIHHSESLMPALDVLCKMTGVKILDMDLFVCTTGPGSFTGLRIGLSTMKGFALATGKPVVGLSTLEALAFNATISSRGICPMLDARKGQIYTALYKKSPTGTMQCLIPDSLSDIRHCLEEMTGEALFLGDGAVRYRNEIEKILGQRCFFGDSFQNHPRGSAVGFLGYQKFKEGMVMDATALAPRYLRLSEAEEKWRLMNAPSRTDSH